MDLNYAWVERDRSWRFPTLDGPLWMAFRRSGYNRSQRYGSGFIVEPRATAKPNLCTLGYCCTLDILCGNKVYTRMHPEISAPSHFIVLHTRTRLTPRVHSAIISRGDRSVSVMTCFHRQRVLRVRVSLAQKHTCTCPLGFEALSLSPGFKLSLPLGYNRVVPRRWTPPARFV